MVQRNYLSKFGGAVFGKSETMMSSIVLPLLRSPEYSVFDLLRYSNGAFYNMRQLWRAVIGCNFIDNVRTLDVPVYIMQGRHDRNTPSELAKAWFDVLDVPRKQWTWFENSAHSPMREEPERWNAAIREQLLS
jgi:pimeloyl-ACP methyl ester carboxylesterase